MARTNTCIEDEMFLDEEHRVYPDPEYGDTQEARKQPRKSKTGAKKSKGKKVALALLLIGSLAAGSIIGTKAFYSHQETKRVDTLINNYSVENYVAFPNEMTSERTYDITFSDGQKLRKRLEAKNVEYISINGNFYTKDGIDIELLTYEVTYTLVKDAIKVQSEGQTMYIAPTGYNLVGKKAVKNEKEIKQVIVPAGTDYNAVSFPNATSWEMVADPELISTSSYDEISSSTLICDIPDGITLDENGECKGTLDLVQKKR